MINLKELFLRAKNFPEYSRLKKLDSQLEKFLIKQTFQRRSSKLMVNQEGEIEGKIKLNTLRIRLKIINYKQVLIYANNEEINEFSERIKIMETILKIYNKEYIKSVVQLMFLLKIYFIIILTLYMPPIWLVYMCYKIVSFLLDDVREKKPQDKEEKQRDEDKQKISSLVKKVAINSTKNYFQKKRNN